MKPIIPFFLIFFFIVFFVALVIRQPSTIKPPLTPSSPTTINSPSPTIPIEPLEAGRLKRVKEIQAVEDLNDIKLSLDGKLAYVPSFDEDTIYVIDVGSDRVRERITTPMPFAVSPLTNNRLAVVNGRQELLVLDQNHERMGPSLKVGNKPYSLISSQDGKLLFVTNTLSNTLSVVDSQNLGLLATIPLGEEPRNMIEDNGLLYVTNFEEGSLSIVSLDSLRVVGKIETGGKPNDIIFSANLKKLFVTDSFTNNLLIIDPQTKLVEGKVPLSEMPFGLDLDQKKDLVFVTGFAKNTLSLVDGKKGVVNKVFSTQSGFLSQGGFNKVSYLPNLGKLYLINTISGKVLVYSLSN